MKKLKLNLIKARDQIIEQIRSTPGLEYSKELKLQKKLEEIYSMYEIIGDEEKKGDE